VHGDVPHHLVPPTSQSASKDSLGHQIRERLHCERVFVLELLKALRQRRFGDECHYKDRRMCVDPRNPLWRPFTGAMLLCKLSISSAVLKFRAKTFGSSSIWFHRLSALFPKTVSALQKTEQELRRYYFKAGSINVRSVAGSKRFCIAAGSTVTITSSVGDTYAART